MLCGCAAFKDSFSRFGQQPAQKAETKAPASIPETAQVCSLDTVACVPQSTSPVAAPDKAAPVVQVPETSYDFGIMSEDKDFVHKFRIKNVGASELKIKKVLPG
jgi:hypothetical protein